MICSACMCFCRCISCLATGGSAAAARVGLIRYALFPSAYSEGAQCAASSRVLAYGREDFSSSYTYNGHGISLTRLETLSLSVLCESADAHYTFVTCLL